MIFIGNWLGMIKMIILIGASASGKTEIAKILTKKGYKKCITTTTRIKRENEIDGVDYHFITKEKFNNLLLQNSFVEVTHYQGNFYGTNKLDLKLDGLIIVDPNGANAIISLLGNQAFVVLIKSDKKIREERMRQRKDKELEIKIRLLSDDKIFKKKNLTKTDLVLKNDEETLEELAVIIDQKYKNYKKKVA